MFIGRKNELKAFERLYKTSGFQMLILYGRRRVGKSTLINEFSKGKKAICFTAVKAGLERNLELFGQEVLSSLAPDSAGLSFSSVENLFMYLAEKCKTDRIIVSIDELPYIAEADSSFLSIMQNYIDRYWLSGQMFLILSGSSVSFMEDEVLSEKSPVFGRRTAQLKLEPFDYLDSAAFVPDYSAEDKALTYGITGGIAKYLSLIDDSLPLDENIRNLFFNKTGFLYEEPSNLLTQEFKNTATYNDVINAIARGSNKLNEIADKAYISEPAASHIIKNLIVTGIVRKDSALTDESNRKKVQYNLCDTMFRFWYRFVPDGISLIETDRGDIYYENIVKPLLNEYMGYVFEEICRAFTLSAGAQKRFGALYTKTGKWWGSDPVKHEETDIDVVALNEVSHTALIGECKYKNHPLEKSVFDSLFSRRNLLSNKYSVSGYLLFSKSNFSDWFKKNPDSQRLLFTLEDLYASKE